MGLCSVKWCQGQSVNDEMGVKQGGSKNIFFLKSSEDKVNQLLLYLNNHQKKFRVKIRLGKAASEPRPFFQLPYTGKNQKIGFFGILRPYFGLVTIFLEYKPQDSMSFNLVFKSLRPRPTLFLTTPFFIQAKIRKLAFLAICVHFLALKPFSLNINRRILCRLIWFLKVSDHAQPYF